MFLGRREEEEGEGEIEEGREGGRKDGQTDRNSLMEPVVLGLNIYNPAQCWSTGKKVRATYLT